MISLGILLIAALFGYFATPSLYSCARIFLTLGVAKDVA